MNDSLVEPLIIFENDYFLAIDKPALWLSVPPREKTDPRPIATHFLAKKKGLKVLLPCHRLDFEVSGLLLLAKTVAAHKSANQWFELHTVQKIYSALTEGSAELAQQFESATTWTSTIVRGKKRSFEAPHGKPSITVVQFLGAQTTSNQLSWHLEPKTGRPHQLRFELSRHGFAIVGDKLYGAKTEFSDKGIALRSVSLDFNNCKDFENYELPRILSANHY